MACKYGSWGCLFRAGGKKNYEGKRRGENEILVQERKTQQLAVKGQSWVGGKEGTVQRGDAGPGFAYSEECIGGEWVESLASSDSLLRWVVRFHGTRCNHQPILCGDETEGEMFARESPRNPPHRTRRVSVPWLVCTVAYLFIQRF